MGYKIVAFRVCHRVGKDGDVFGFRELVLQKRRAAAEEKHRLARRFDMAFLCDLHSQFFHILPGMAADDCFFLIRQSGRGQ